MWQIYSFANCPPDIGRLKEEESLQLRMCKPEGPSLSEVRSEQDTPQSVQITGIQDIQRVSICHVRGFPTNFSFLLPASWHPGPHCKARRSHCPRQKGLSGWGCREGLAKESRKRSSHEQEFWLRRREALHNGLGGKREKEDCLADCASLLRCRR